MTWEETAVALLMSIDGSILIAYSWWEVGLGANAGAKTSGIALKQADVSWPSSLRSGASAHPSVMNEGRGEEN